MLSLMTITTNQILLSYVVVTYETEDKWMWFRPQLEQDFPGSYVLLEEYSKGIEIQQLQGDIRNSIKWFFYIE